jgi:hypothetical protein
VLPNCLATRKTIGRTKRHWLVAFMFLAICASARSQSSKQFLPEIDTYLRLSPLVRVSFQAKQTREGGDPTQVEIGPSIDFYLKPWIKLVVSAGYRVLPSPNTTTERRLELVATSNFPLKGSILLSDRNRMDLDWQNGGFSWRYRNRLSLERSLNIGAYHPRIYARSEEFYESQYQKWTTTALYAGSTLPFGRRMDLSPYYCHQNNTGKKPNQQLNQVGLIANFYFSLKGK